MICHHDGRAVREESEGASNDHRDHLVIHRLRINKPLTETDLEGLEQSLIEIGEGNGETLLGDLLERSDAPSLAYFVKCMVGMDRAAAQSAFVKFCQINLSLTRRCDY